MTNDHEDHINLKMSALIGIESVSSLLVEIVENMLLYISDISLTNRTEKFRLRRVLIIWGWGIDEKAFSRSSQTTVVLLRFASSVV